MRGPSQDCRTEPWQGQLLACPYMRHQGVIAERPSGGTRQHSGRSLWGIKQIKMKDRSSNATSKEREVASGGVKLVVLMLHQRYAKVEGSENLQMGGPCTIATYHSALVPDIMFEALDEMPKNV
jgi:hypothetical protein